MINRDKFDALESISSDRAIFSHISVACITFSLSLGIEKIVEYRQSPADAQFYIAVCGIVLIVGLASGAFSYLKARKYGLHRKELFDNDKLISDTMFLQMSDGTSVQSDMLIQGDTSSTNRR
jgi:hypothetical protein